MREAVLIIRKGSGATGRQGAGEADRFALVNPAARWWVRWSWFVLPFLVLWLALWAAEGLRDNIPQIVGGAPLLAYYGWIAWTGRRRAEGPEHNFVELTEDQIRVHEFVWMNITVAYADIGAVRPATKMPLLQRRFRIVSKRDLASYFEIELRKPRWRGPFRIRRLFFRPAEPNRFEFALKARLERLAKRTETSS